MELHEEKNIPYCRLSFLLASQEQKQGLCVCRAPEDAVGPCVKLSLCVHPRHLSEDLGQSIIHVPSSENGF